MKNDDDQALTPQQALLAAAACGMIAGGFAYLETHLIALAIPAAAITAVALAIALPRQPFDTKSSIRSEPLPRSAVGSTVLLLSIGIGLAVWLSSWAIAAATAAAIVFWLVLATLRRRN